MDVTSDTVAANNLLTGETATKADGTKVTGTYNGGQVSEKNVNFIDYDNTFLYSYTVEEAREMTSLPELPTHPDDVLECLGWTWTLADINIYLDSIGEYTQIYIGPRYAPKDGLTRIFIKIPYENFEIFTNFGSTSYHGSCSIDWGDGNSTEVQDIYTTSDGNGRYTLNISHIYSEPGEYTITYELSGFSTSTPLAYFGYANCGSLMLNDNVFSTTTGMATSDSANKKMLRSLVYKIYNGLSNKSVVVGNRGCQYLMNVEEIEGLNGSIYTCDGCQSLKRLSFNNPDRSHQTNAFYNCSSLEYLPLSGYFLTRTRPFGYSNMLSGCSSLKRLPVSSDGYYNYDMSDLSSLTEITALPKLSNLLFPNATALKSVVIPSSAACITSQGLLKGRFSGCTSLTYFTMPEGVVAANTSDLLVGCTQLPYLEIPSTFTGTFGRMLKNTGVKRVKFLGLTPPTFTYAPTEWLTTTQDSCDLLIPRRSLYKYMSAANFGPPSKCNIVPYGDGFYIADDSAQFYLDDVSSMTITAECLFSDSPTITTTSADTSVASVTSPIYDSTAGVFTFSIERGAIVGSTEITVNAVWGSNSQSQVVSVNVGAEKPLWRVESVEGATYGFSINNSGYYESANKGVGNSAAVCKIVFCDRGSSVLHIDYINSGESSYDYGAFSNIDTALSTSYTADASALIFKSCKGESSTDVKYVEYPSQDTDEHFIYVKYRKDSSTNSGNDSLQFKVSLI